MKNIMGLAILAALLGTGLALAEPVGSDQQEADKDKQLLRDARTLFDQGQYFQAARYSFAASQAAPDDSRLEAQAYSWIAVSLVRAGLPHAASYFFIRTLETRNKTAIRRVLGDTEALFVRVGGDLFRRYLIKHTKYEDYDSRDRSAYLYSLGKEALLTGKEQDSIRYLSGVYPGSRLWPLALQLRATAYAIGGNNEAAMHDFRECQSSARMIASFESSETRTPGRYRNEAETLRSRCIAGEARTLYQMGRFDDADFVYDRIAKGSYVWPDILFEQAWNSFARNEYNRTLGRLVSYKSPALQFVFNTEVDVLRAQSFLALCLYADANDVVNEFNAKYSRVGEEIKNFVERNANDLPAFYSLGKQALRSSIYTSRESFKMLNRFVRAPYFQNLAADEREIENEKQVVAREAGQGFSAFLERVLSWRTRTVQLVGGVFIKNSLIDYHRVLISDFEKMAFIKLEMLKLAKDALMGRPAVTGSERQRGNVIPSRKDYQYYWSFNGEFWNDELGDYVFGLESACTVKDGA